MTKLHDGIAQHPVFYGGILRCTVCGHEERLRNTAGFLTNGWPKCCNYTMTLITAAQLEQEQ